MNLMRLGAGTAMRLPEPHEILSWASRQWALIRRYFQDRDHRTLWGIILLAAILRLSSLDLIEFKADEARHLANALEIIRSFRLPLVGTASSVGISKPPMMTYLMALPVLLGRDPRYASGFIAVLNIAGVAGFYLLARRYYGWRVAALSATLFAANPWAVLFSRKVFTADMLAPFAVLMLYGLCLGAIDRKPVGWTIALVALGIMLNITFSPWPLLLVLLLLLAVYSQRVSWPHVLLGIGLVAILFLPYLYYQGLHRFADVHTVIRALLPIPSPPAASAPLSPTAVSVLPLQFATWLHSGVDIVSLSGASAPDFRPARSWLAGLDRLAAAIFVASLVSTGILALRTWARWRERRDSVPYVIPMLWLWVPILLFPYQPAALELHYLVVLYPVGFLAMGLLLDQLLAWARSQALQRRGWSPLLQAVLGALFLAIVARQAYTVFYLYGFVAQHDTSYGVPYRHWGRTVEMVRREAREARTDQVWVIARGSDIGYEADPLILDYLLGPQIRAVFLGQGGNESLLLPAARPGVYLLTRSSPPAEALLRQLQADERGVVPFPDKRSQARLWVASPRKAEEALALIRQRGFWACDSGARLLGYDWPADARGEQMARLATYWTFDNVPSQERRAQHSVFNHLLAPDGTRVAQRDGFGLPERYWEEGLLLVQWYDLPLPANMAGGDYSLLTGMYRLSDMSRNRWLDEQGRDGGDAVTLGPLQIGP